MKIVRDGEAVARGLEEGVFPECVAGEIRVLKLAPGEMLFKKGMAAEYLAYLISGRMKTCMDFSDGRTSVLNFPTAPCYLGEIEFLSGALCRGTVTAVTECLCLAVPMRFGNTLLKDNGFVRTLGVYLCKKLARAERRASKIVCYPLSCRLAEFILVSSHGDRYREPRQEAADYLGVTYRHLLYVLAEFIESGNLKKDGRGFRIADRAALEMLAAPLLAEEEEGEPG